MGSKTGGKPPRRKMAMLVRRSTLPVVLATVMLAGCGSSSSSSSTPATSIGAATSAPASSSTTANASGVKFAPLVPIVPGSGAGVKIGYIALDNSVPYIRTVTQGMQAAAKKAGAQLFVCDAKSSASVAEQCARNFVVQGVQGILNFNSQAAASPQVCAAGPKVPTIAIDIPQPPCQISFLGVSNVGAGFVDGQGGALAYKQKSGCKYDAMVVVGQSGVGQPLAERQQGMMAGWKSVCGPTHDVRIVETQNGTASEAKTRLTDALTALPSPKKVVVLSLVGIQTDGDLAAIKSAGRTNDVSVLGFGAATSQLCTFMKNPDWLGDTLLFPEDYGPIGIPAIVKAIKHQRIPTTLYIPTKFGDRQTIPHYYPQLGSCARS